MLVVLCAELLQELLLPLWGFWCLPDAQQESFIATPFRGIGTEYYFCLQCLTVDEPTQSCRHTRNVTQL